MIWLHCNRNILFPCNHSYLFIPKMSEVHNICVYKTNNFTRSKPSRNLLSIFFRISLNGHNNIMINDLISESRWKRRRRSSWWYCETIGSTAIAMEANYASSGCDHCAQYTWRSCCRRVFWRRWLIRTFILPHGQVSVLWFCHYDIYKNL